MTYNHSKVVTLHRKKVQEEIDMEETLNLVQECDLVPFFPEYADSEIQQ